MIGCSGGVVLSRPGDSNAAVLVLGESRAQNIPQADAMHALQAPRVVDPHGRSYNRLVTAINQPALNHGSALMTTARGSSTSQTPASESLAIL